MSTSNHIITDQRTENHASRFLPVLAALYSV